MTNHVRRTMHILDVISSVFRSSKCIKIVGGWGFAPDPTGRDYSASLDPQLGLRGLLLRPLRVREGKKKENVGKKGKEREGGAKMIYAVEFLGMCGGIYGLKCFHSMQSINQSINQKF